ncbi:MAG TPA: substrate-binding domain-containing protein [Bryobacteraceae bacterium]|nr:substrate-binding domain-containing protein [Bryobacteraceae bacterium]
MKIRTLLLLCLSLAALSCNRSTAKRIAFVPKGRAHVFWQSVHAGAIAAERENPGFTVVWNGPASETDFEGEIQIVDAAINQHVDAICLAPIDKKVLVAVVERAAAQGIPVIIFDSPIDTDKFVAQVATDNYAGGQLGATRMAEILNGKGKIAEVAVQPGSASTMAREQGFEEELAKKAPGIKLVDKQYGMADFGQSLKVAENMLTAAPDLSGMFASNESSTVGAARAVKDRPGVKLVGFDSSPQLIEALKSGVIDSLVVQDPFQMGYKSMVAAVAKLKGGTPERIQNITPTLVTKDNMSDPEIQKKINPDLDKYLK